MDKSRLDTPRSGYRDDVSSHTKKTKKRSSKRSSFLDSWMNSLQNNQNNDTMPNAEYQHLLWQTNVQQNFPSNGQRLFAATSDPSMCGYAQMPMTYTMEPVSLPTMYRLYQPMPFSGVRTVHGRPRKQYNQNNPMNLRMNSMPNGYSSLQESRVEPPVPINYQNGDYTSLPPTANKNNDITPDELNSEHRRYSDPGIGSADAAIHGQSEESDSVDSSSSITTIGRSNKLVLSLIEQMSELKKSNSQLFKELNETKSELGSMKAQLAQCKYSSFSDYQPGMLSDFIREIRQANKSSEEGLFSKVKSMVEEKLNQRSLEVVNLNNQIAKLLAEKEESDRRIVKLEEEVTTLKLNAKLEKLLDILGNKMIVATDQGATPDLIDAKCTRNRSSSSLGEEEEDDERDAEEETRRGRRDAEEQEDDGNVDEKGNTGYREKNPERLSMIENGIKLSGPVTDL